MASKPSPKPTFGTTRISPMGTQARDAQAAARAKAYQDRNDPSKMTPAQKAAYLANPGRSNY
jgi:hypothetical protein